MIKKEKILNSLRGVILFALILPVFSVKAETAVLPFRISGTPSVFSIQNGPEYLQEAFYFFFQIQKDSPLQDLMQTRRAVADSGFTSSNKLNENKAVQLCIQTRADYLLTGSADFPSSGRVQISGLTFSCKNKKIAVSKSLSGPEQDLQILVSRLVTFITPYSHDIHTSRSISKSAGDFNISAVIDMSGSMTGLIDDILKGIEGSMKSLSRNSSLTIYLLHNNSVQRIQEKNYTAALRKIKSYQTSGSSTEADLLQAISQIENYYSWKTSNRLLLFTDMSVKKKESLIESRLIRLQGKGMSIQPFLLPAQSYETKKFWIRLSRIMDLPDPSVLYARRIGFLEGFSRMLIMKGDKFFLSERDVSEFIKKNQLPEPVHPVQTVLYEKRMLNMNDLPGQIAKSENLRIAGMGSLLTGLERKIELTVLEGTSSDKSRYKVLLNNNGSAFWIQMDSYKVYKLLIDAAGKSIYVGLNFMPAVGQEMTPVNLPDHVYVRSAAYTPRLMINEWRHFSGLSADRIKTEDTWFFPVKVVEYKDVRQDEDIRQ